MELRVAFDSEIFYLQRQGGISRYYTNLIDALMNYQVSIGVLGYFHRNIHFSNIEKSISPAPKYFDFDFLGAHPYRILNKVSEFSSPWQVGDIIHKTYYNEDNISLRACKKVITVHDLIEEETASSCDRSNFLKARAITECDGIICVSHYTKSKLLEHYSIDPNKVCVVHHGGNHLNVLCPDVANDFHDQHKPFVLFVGPRSGYKNFDLVIKAFSENKNICNYLDIVCFGGGAFSDEEAEKISNLRKLNCFVYQYSGSDSVLKHLYKKCLALVCPSIYEGFGLPPLEALSLGCPVISSRAEVFQETLMDCSLYFDAFSSDSLAEAILEIMNDYNYRKKIAHRAAENSARFTWENTAQKTLNFYRYLLG